MNVHFCTKDSLFIMNCTIIKDTLTFDLHIYSSPAKLKAAG